ncbi:MAG: PorV/PorQ family protein [Elusimicrobiota bacterium]
MRLSALLTAAILTGASAAASAAFTSVTRGTSGGQFLEVAPGARPAGMGGAFAGAADDVYSVYYNPAGLAGIRSVELSGMDDQYFQSINYGFAGLAVPLLAFEKDSFSARNAYGVLGVGVYNLSLGNIPVQGNVESAAPTGTVAAQDLAYTLSYAYALPQTGLSLGVTGKYVTSSLAGYNASVFAADAGAMYRRERWSAGAGLRNLGPEFGFAGQADPLPFLLYAGGGYRITDHWLGTLEVDLPRDNSAAFAVGTEYVHSFTGKITGTLRAGYNTANTDAGGYGGASLGAGVGYGNFNLDFAFIPFGDLGNTFRYSFLVKF